MGDFSILAQRIKQLRQSQNLTQKEFAEKVGCTAATLSAYENGSKSPSLEIVKGIAQTFGVSLDWLCGLSENETTDKKPETFADIIMILNSMLNVKDLNAFLAFIQDPDFWGPEEDAPYVGAIAFNNETITSLIKEWIKYRELGIDDELNKNINQMWLDQIRKKHNEPITCELPFD